MLNNIQTQKTSASRNVKSASGSSFKFKGIVFMLLLVGALALAAPLSKMVGGGGFEIVAGALIGLGLLRLK